MKILDIPFRGILYCIVYYEEIIYHKMDLTSYWKHLIGDAPGDLFLYVGEFCIKSNLLSEEFSDGI